MKDDDTIWMFSTSQCAIVLKITDRQVRRLCASGKLKGAAQSGRRGRWKIPATAHRALEAIQRVQKVCPVDGREQLGKLVGVLLTEIERLKKVVKNIQSFL